MMSQLQEHLCRLWRIEGVGNRGRRGKQESTVYQRIHQSKAGSLRETHNDALRNHDLEANPKIDRAETPGKELNISEACWKEVQEVIQEESQSRQRQLDSGLTRLGQCILIHSPCPSPCSTRSLLYPTTNQGNDHQLPQRHPDTFQNSPVYNSLAIAGKGHCYWQHNLPHPLLHEYEAPRKSYWERSLMTKVGVGHSTTPNKKLHYQSHCDSHSP